MINNMHADPLLDTYLQDIAAFDRLDAVAEQAVIRRLRTGCRTARQELVHAHLHVVVCVAREFVDSGLPMLDLIEEGNLGLLRTVDRFRPEFGCRFATYARHWIRQAIRQAITDKVRPVRLPAYLVGQIRRWRQAVQRGETGGPELAQRLGISAANMPLVSRLATVSERRAPCQLEEHPAPEEACPEAALCSAESQGVLRRAVAGLSPRDAAIIRHRFGLDGHPALSPTQVAAVFGLSRERIGQIERAVLERLRPTLAAAGVG